ncbi:YdcF family protein [Cuneatibacter caecimuris]|uniref:Uncharacterized SAM-binding protein YcdF (DUF218 family) n=1 Tax=Cuneatibacter caecimuris TaxID=1796618 RepID=A0A4Q7PR34_9FIRM|nr:YdcF family protein [Cuneatibacter caecimuris]RZT02796.1 uncharacterized SAM-binding protein YcdF (DUF218 family) [Cuneatibacter caecimuris]
METVYLTLFFISLFWLGIFWAVKKKTNTGLGAGFLFCLFLGTFGTLLLLLGLKDSSEWAYVLLAGIALLAAVLLLFGIYILIAFLIGNSIIMLKREKFRLSHILTLLFAVGIVGFIAAAAYIGRLRLSPVAAALWSGVLGVVVFFAFHVFLFMETLLLHNIFRPRKRADYIIVLGGGLKNGKVTPLLAARVDAALKFAWKQSKTGRKPPLLIMSGGQGEDEPLSEAEAMKEYAMEQGYDESRILLEDQSGNTAENMKFSREIMEEHSEGKPYRCVYATSSYHLLRAGIYARRAGMLMGGIGGKTAFYYLPNAVLREYIAYLVMHKKNCIAAAGGVFLLCMIVSIILYVISM